MGGVREMQARRRRGMVVVVTRRDGAQQSAMDGGVQDKTSDDRES